MNENNWKERFYKEKDNGNFDGGCGYFGAETEAIMSFISKTLQQQRDEIAKEVEDIMIGYSVRELSSSDDILAVINSQQNKK